MITAELGKGYEMQLGFARDMLGENKIGRLAVQGPEESPDALIARDLGIKEVDLYSTPREVVEACAEVGVAGILPIGTIHQEQPGGNLDLWKESRRASIADILNPRTQRNTRILIADPNSLRGKENI